MTERVGFAGGNGLLDLVAVEVQHAALAAEGGLGPVLMDDHQVSTSTSVDERSFSETSQSSICLTPLKTMALAFILCCCFGVFLNLPAAALTFVHCAFQEAAESQIERH